MSLVPKEVDDEVSLIPLLQVTQERNPGLLIKFYKEIVEAISQTSIQSGFSKEDIFTLKKRKRENLLKIRLLEEIGGEQILDRKRELLQENILINLSFMHKTVQRF